MAKIEYLNKFFTERLLALAGELFQAVTDVITEYQEETDRTKQENIYLKEMLTAERLANGRDGSSYQAVTEELPNISQDTNSSVIQVKVELSTTKQDNMSPESINDPSTATTPHYFSGNTISFPTDEEIKFTIKSEPRDSEIIISDDSNPAMQSESIIDCNFEGLSSDPSSHETQQSETAEKNVCPCCGKTFLTPGQLKRHMAVHQKNRPRPYRCDLCGKSYAYAQVLEIHRRTHTGERPYHCKFCERRFNQKGHLIEHERIHTGEKPFICPICGKRFIQSSQVRKHVSFHHPEVQRS
ncbi:hypothetical protein Q7C36_020657 [Tachysurus vachellii]|uniref:C2H2-type domain-containing protein n=2 Tax=Tachysurus vachellii TaxID=175792 RepID=A0AA88IVB0_TACVA|nr:hypothetical protein Q7C36_020657 [Tachysurus vachellii]